MAIQFTIENDGCLVIERFSGMVKIDDIVTQINRLANEPSIQPGAVNIADFRPASLADFGAEDVEQLVRVRSANSGRNRISKLALLLNDVQGFQRALRYETLMRQTGVEVLLSSSMTTICRFLDLDEVSIEAQLLKLAAAESN